MVTLIEALSGFSRGVWPDARVSSCGCPGKLLSRSATRPETTRRQYVGYSAVDWLVLYLQEVEESEGDFTEQQLEGEYVSTSAYSRTSRALTYLTCAHVLSRTLMHLTYPNLHSRTLTCPQAPHVPSPTSHALTYLTYLTYTHVHSRTRE